jgi:hypothetical protein
MLKSIREHKEQDSREKEVNEDSLEEIGAGAGEDDHYSPPYHNHGN